MNERYDPELVLDIHRALSESVTGHMEKNGLGWLTRASDFTSESDLFKFEKKMFEATPRAYSPALVNCLVKAVEFATKKPLLEMRGRQPDPFENQMSAIEDSLNNNRLMLLTEHKDEFAPMLGAHKLQRSIMHNLGMSFEEIVLRTYVLGSRALAYSEFRLPSAPLLSLPRQMANICLTLGTPGLKELLPKGSKDFLTEYAGETTDEFFKETRDVGSIAILAASSANDKRREDGTYVMERVGPGLIKRVIRRGKETSENWDIIALAQSHRKGKFPMAVAGKLIKAADVDSAAIHQEMSWLADQQTKMGTPTVYNGSPRLNAQCNGTGQTEAKD